MSAASLGVGRALPSATVRTTGWLVLRTLRIVAVVAPLVLLMTTGVAPAVTAFLANDPNGSLWTFVVESMLPFFSLVLGAMTITHLASHLAFGMTRRSFAAAVVLTVLAFTAVLALIVPLGYLLEGAHFRAYGWAHDVPEGVLVATQASAVRTVVWGITGALNGAIWYRFGAFVGVAVSVFTALFPVALANIWAHRYATLGAVEVWQLIGLIAVLVVAYVAVVMGAAVRGKAA